MLLPSTWALMIMLAGFEKRAAKLLRESRRILVYHAILKTKPAEAFLALLKSLQQNSKDAILSDYSKFYQELSKTHSVDWRDFIIEEVRWTLHLKSCDHIWFMYCLKSRSMIEWFLGQYYMSQIAGDQEMSVQWIFAVLSKIKPFKLLRDCLASTEILHWQIDSLWRVQSDSR